MNPPRTPWYLYPGIAALFFLSGATSLVYEVAWLRALLLIFGSTAFAVSTVLTAFMGGLAAGAFAGGRWADRLERPLAVYGLLEIGIGVYAVGVPLLFGALEPLYRLVWGTLHPPLFVFALVRFALSVVVLFLPTAMMGATLPVLARACARLSGSLASRVGGLYGVNTLGAFAGTVASGFILLRLVGLSATIWLTAAVNLVIGSTALGMAVWERRRAPAAALEPEEAAPVGASAPRTSALGRGVVLAAFAVTGFAALMLEVAWTRVLSLVFGPSVYAFAVMLAAFLVGLGLGSVVVAALIGRGGWSGERPFLALAAAAGLLAYVTLLAFHRLPGLYRSLSLPWFGSGVEPTAVLATGLVVSGIVMLPATLAMGGLFPAALAAYGVARRSAGRDAGGLYAANGVGAILGAFAGGFVAVPLFGLQGTVIAASWLYLAVAGVLLWQVLGGRGRAWLAPAAAAVLGVVLWSAAPPWDRLLMSTGRYGEAGSAEGAEAGVPEAFADRAEEYRDRLGGVEVLFYREGLMSTVLVARDRDEYYPLGERMVPMLSLFNNGKADASSYRDMPTQVLVAQIPLLLHPAPRAGLVIGLASGTTAGSALTHELESLDVVEIEAAVVEASRYFDFVSGSPLDDPRTRLTVADARTVLLLEDRAYDVIMSEPSNPWMTGVSNLFTLEFFELARSRLAEGGIFAQWLHFYSMSPENLEALLRTFHSAFPESYIFSTIAHSDLLLVGANDPLDLDLRRLEQRLARPAVRADLRRIGVRDVAEFLARGRLGPRELAALVGADGPLNTDDNALIEYAAPLDLYRNTRRANAERLQASALGLAPYLRGAGSEFYLRLAEAYQEQGFRSEALAALEAAARAAPP